MCDQVDCTTKMCNSLAKQGEDQKKINNTPQPIRQIDMNTSIALLKKILSEYFNLNERVSKLHNYEPLHISSYEPEQRYIRRHWIDNMQLSKGVALMKRPYGATIGNINVLWKIVPDDENHETNKRQKPFFPPPNSFQNTIHRK